MTKALADALQRAVDLLVTRFRPSRVILFGSHARGDAGPDSDVDLLVLFDRLESGTRMASEIYSALADAGFAKDIVVGTGQQAQRYRDVPGTIYRPAMREGKVLHEAAA